MKLEVILQNTTPYHSSQPGEARVTLSGEFVSGRNGFPAVLTRKMPIIAASRDRDSEELPKPRLVPIMPANSLRHELRASIVGQVFDHLRGKATLSVGAYAAATCGNASGNPDGVPASFEEVRSIRNHPILGLFGGGPRMISGRLSVDSAWAITQDSSALLGDYPDQISTGRLTTVVFKRRVDPIIAAASTENVELIADAAQSITAWSNQYAGASEADETDTRGLRSFSAHEVVIPGVSWLWRISVDRPTSAQRGAVLSALTDIQHRRIGGMGSQGYGSIRIQSVLLDGEEVWSGQSFADNNTAINDALTSWADAIDGISPQQFEAFAASAKLKPAADAPAKTRKAKK